MITWVQIATVVLAPFVAWAVDQETAQKDHRLGRLEPNTGWAPRALRHRVLLWHGGQLLILSGGLLVLSLACAVLTLPVASYSQGRVEGSSELSARVMISYITALPLGLALTALCAIVYAAWFWFKAQAAMRLAESEQRGALISGQEEELRLLRRRLKDLGE